MPSERKILAGEVAKDIRSGMGDVELMEKYKLSAKGLQSLFKKILNARIMRPSDFSGRYRTYDHTVVLEDPRSSPRESVGFSLPVHELNHPEAVGLVRDLSELGLRVDGISVEVGQTKTLVIPAQELFLADRVVLEAQCTWTDPGESAGTPTVGLQIMKVLEGDLNKLIATVRSSVPAAERPPYIEVFPEDGDTTESVDLSSVLSGDLTVSGSFSFVGITKTWFGKLLQALPIPALLIDEEFKVSFANQAANKIGVSCSAVRGAPFSSFFPNSTEAAEAQSFAQRVYSTRKAETYQSVLEFDRRRIWGRISFRAVRMGSNRSLLILIEDLTHEKEQLELQKQLLHAQKMEAVGLLAGGIAHDFNNLLTVIMGYSELLAATGNIDEQVRTDLRKIHRASVRGGDLVNRLLTFSRKGEVQPQLLNLNEQIEQVNSLLSRAIPKIIDIELDLTACLDPLRADPGQIEQVLMNLAVNARDAMPEGGRLVIQTANVNHDTEQSESPGDKRSRFVMLSVSDTGHGMDQETLERIFEPFFTTKEKGRGTGLGLAIAYSIVQQHGGRIECESFPGVGTTFRILWPATEGEPEPERREEPAITPGGTETVLLVDDEDDVRDLGKTILEAAGYRVIEAANGAEALEICRKQGRRIALVILDLIMPGMSGNECVQELIRCNPGVKILISSGYPSGGIADNALQTNAAGFVNKPYSVKELLRAVRARLDGA